MNDFIGVYDNALSSNECKKIIQLFDNDLPKMPGTIGSGKDGKGRLEPEKKSCIEYKGSFDFANNALEFEVNKSIVNCLSKYTPLYRKDNYDLDQIQNWMVSPGYNIQKYEPEGAYFKLHCENDGNHSVIRRMLVWMIYLNTVTDAGGTYFSQFDKTTDAVEGRVVIWPAFWTHFHKGIPSPTQIKYIATGWYNFE